MHDKWVLRYGLFATAKRWWGWSLLMKVAATALGSLAIVAPLPVAFPALGAFGLTILSELFAVWSDAAKGIAQKLQDKLDLEDGLGWPISSDEVRDIVLQSPVWVRRDAESRTLQKSYFASKDPPGPRRVLENLDESAWWSQHQAWKMFGISLTAILVVVVGAIVFLLVMAFIGDTAGQVTTARLMIGVLSLLPSLGAFKLVIGYYKFHHAAAKIQDKAKQLAKGKPKEPEAVKLVYEYQFARVSAPLLPDWLYRWHQDELNKLWENYRPPTAASQGPAGAEGGSK